MGRWQDRASTDEMPEHPVRRVVAPHDVRFEGFSDLLLRARGRSVLDVGCNRGHIGWDFAANGADLIHGCDIDRPSILCARMWFSELPNVRSKFEVVNLEGGAEAMTAAFGDQKYDIVLFLGVQHKLKRTMSGPMLAELMKHLAGRATMFFCWTGYLGDLPEIQRAMAQDFRQVHFSELVGDGRPAVIWKRKETP